MRVKRIKLFSSDYDELLYFREIISILNYANKKKRRSDWLKNLKVATVVDGVTGLKWIDNIQEGMLVYDTRAKKIMVRIDGGWVVHGTNTAISDSANELNNNIEEWKRTGNLIYKT
jgi:undecaprenyl pyrophosphate phosphatase UppP